MVMEVEADMERVLGRFSLRLIDGADQQPCGGGERSSGGGGGGMAAWNKEAAGGGAVKERIARALRLYKEAADEDEHGGGALVQVWAPVRDGGRRVLATRGQPFVLASQCHRLFQYRTVSLTHVFAFGGGGGGCCSWEERGLPGRVFDAGAPEWTPNVQFYGTGEYARMSYALIYDIQGSLALPILDPATRRCLAVLELVMTTTAPTARFAGEVDKLCNALQAVALGSPKICHPVAAEECNSNTTEVAMSEVSELLATVCEDQGLPMAQAWVRCQCCSSTDGGDGHYSLTTAGAPFHLAAGADGGFREACAEHHLRRGQGLVGEAAAARVPSFCADVARRSKDAYPLAHYARMHGLAGCLAVPLLLRLSGASAMDDGREEEEECDRVVLEFFLPPDCRSATEQKVAVDAVFAMVREQCSGGLLKTIAMSDLQDLSLEAGADGDHIVPADAGPGDCVGEEDSDEENEHTAADVADGDQSASADQDKGAEDPTSEPEKKKKKKKTGRKAGKPVSLEDLRGYFSGSLKDAARSLGVCPTTMKRICRQHGISRWPFRKISKVKRALGKINRAAIESADCSPKPITASSSSSQPAPHLPCLSSALGVASSQGSSQEPPHCAKAKFRKSSLQRSDGADRRVVTIKASYKGDIIRFRVPSSAGVATVKEEVAKRLALDAGAMEVKYLDDDQEWVNLSCDADFQECLDVAPALPPSASAVAAPVVRLMVLEAAHNLGSSCGSSD